MKNQNEAASGQQKLSAPTIIVLAIGGVLILYMLLQPMFAPKDQLPVAANNSSPAVAATQSDVTQPTPANSTVNLSEATATSSLGILSQTSASEPVSDRDPFVPSAILNRKPVATEAKTDTEPLISSQVAKTEIMPAIKILPEIKPTVKPAAAPAVTPPEKFSWKGIVGGSGAEQVVLIQHNARTYVLHQGDPVPGTKYTVTEITPEMVVLASPSDQLRLAKKKEAKING